ncbi:MAG: ThiF family adenylyltransferase, partial [Polyangiaceae bacterium]
MPDHARRGAEIAPENARYHRQMLWPAIGAEGQQKLRDARVLLIGCGA